MERLTQKIGDHIVFPSELVGVELTPDNATMCSLLQRLSAYEDTGLMPDEALSTRMDMAIINAMFQNADVERMKELIEADKDGRLVVLPVKQDAIIHSISKGCSVPMQSRLEGCFITESGEIEYQAIFGDVLESDFGKTVFLSYKDAAAALKGSAHE